MTSTLIWLFLPQATPSLDRATSAVVEFKPLQRKPQSPADLQILLLPQAQVFSSDLENFSDRNRITALHRRFDRTLQFCARERPPLYCERQQRELHMVGVGITSFGCLIPAISDPDQDGLAGVLPFLVPGPRAAQAAKSSILRNGREERSNKILP
ncbi:MAG: hypothetical protein L6R42_002315 [Xanthoria sp. 1 TBL-2021]|nr:MAG: hypothetical protein L6R42_002315 [Xanthoria sp. 1 TBL-2021]